MAPVPRSQHNALSWRCNATTNTNRNTRTERFRVREFRSARWHTHARETEEKARDEAAEKEQGQGLAFPLSAPLAFGSLSLLTFPGETIPCESPPRNLRANERESFRVRQFAPVVAEGLFVKISEQVERLHADIGAVKLAFYQTPEIFHRVRVDVAARVLYGVIHNGMAVVTRKPVVRLQRITEQRRTRLDVLAYLLVEFMLAPRRDGKRANVTAPLHHTQGDGLIRSTRASDNALTFRVMHVARLSTNERFIDFDFTGQLRSGFVLHRFPNPVKHEPRSLLSQAEITGDFTTTHAIATVGHKPHRREPLIKRDRRFVQNRADLHGELLPALSRLALPDSARFKEHWFLGPAVGTLHSIRPPLGREVVQ